MRDERIKEGMKVRSADGNDLGKIVAVEPDSFVIEKGFFFPKDYLVRFADVRSVEGDVVHLALGGDALRRADLSEPVEREPIGTEAAGVGTTGARGYDTGREETTIPLAEEEITAVKRDQEVGRVRVHKDVVTEDKQITVPVRKEEVRVERVPASGTASEADFSEGTEEIAVHEERVEIEKRPVVREEVRIGKDVHEETKTESARVRRETADVETTGEVEKVDEEELRP